MNINLPIILVVIENHHAGPSLSTLTLVGFLCETFLAAAGFIFLSRVLYDPVSFVLFFTYCFYLVKFITILLSVSLLWLAF